MLKAAGKGKSEKLQGGRRSMSEQPAPWASGVNQSLRIGARSLLLPSIIFPLLHKSPWNPLGTHSGRGREIFSPYLMMLVTSQGFHGDKTKEPGGLGELGQMNPSSSHLPDLEGRGLDIIHEFTEVGRMGFGACSSSVAQSCPTLCNPMDCSMPGFPVQTRFPYHLPGLAQTHAY